MASSDRDSNPKLTVPKFSSFRANHTIEVGSSGDPKRKYKDEESHCDRQSQKSEKRHRSSHRHRCSHESSHSRRRHGGTPRHHHHLHEPGSEKALPEILKPRIFVIDTAGDPLITRFGGIDRAQIPSYHRHGGGKVLGTIGRLVIHRGGTRDQFSLRFPGDVSQMLDRDGLRSKSFRFKGESIRIRASRRARNVNGEYPDGFLQVGRSRKHSLASGQSDSSGDEGPSYRSIRGKAKTQNFDDESSESSSEEEAIDIQKDNPLKWKSIQLSRRVKDHPGDIDAWLELVDHQDDLQRAGESIDERTTAHAAHSFSEIKVSMLESALENATAVEDRQAVIVRLMREGMKIWPAKHTAKRWSEFARNEEHSFELWRAHIDFAMTDIASVNYDDIKQMLLDRLQKIQTCSHHPAKDDYSEAIYVFLRAMRFIHDAGYQELAVASWQAMLETHFFRPVNPDDNHMDSFRDFWESEAPRIGDTQAQGWSQYIRASGQVNAPEPRMASSRLDVSTGDVYKAWGHHERSRGDASRIPARTMDDDTEDDPFRVVMFSDIEPWLFSIPESLMNEPLRKEIIDAFLIFCGLAPSYRSSKLIQLACTDEFTFSCSSFRDSTSAVFTSLESSVEIVRKSPRFHVENALMVMSPSVLFSGKKWFGYFGMNSERSAVDLSWVSNTIEQLVYLADVQSLALYYLGFTFSLKPAAVKKSAKSVLKKYPNVIELYNGYALAEYANDNVDIAERVIGSAVESSSLSEGPYGFELFKTWSWIALEEGNKKMATLRICWAIDNTIRHSMTELDSVSPARVLKTRQALESKIHRALYEGRVEHASIYGELLVLWSYLTEDGCVEPTSAKQGNISASMCVVEKISTDFTATGYADSLGHERLLQFGARVLYLNASRGPFRRVYLRDQLLKFVERFPRNTVFLSLVEWTDSSLRIIDETRQLLHNSIFIRDRDCITSRIFSIQHELSRGNVNSARAAYEYALSTDVCRSSVGLWVLYVRFCYQNKELRSKAKDVFFRALRNCPWSKKIMMEAFGTLIHDMEPDELRSVYDTMASKGLRIHADLEEYVEIWTRHNKRQQRCK